MTAHRAAYGGLACSVTGLAANVIWYLLPAGSPHAAWLDFAHEGLTVAGFFLVGWALGRQETPGS